MRIAFEDQNRTAEPGGPGADLLDEGAVAGPEGDRPLVISLCDESRAIVGGLWGMTGYEWLFIQLL